MRLYQQATLLWCLEEKQRPCKREQDADENNFPVHHILPRSKGGPDEDWNLMALCPSCHRTTDAQNNAVKYPHEYQSKLSDFDEPEEEPRSTPSKEQKS